MPLPPLDDRLDCCSIHGAGPCDCPAYLIVMGCMDSWIERQLEIDPGFGAMLTARLRAGAER